MQLAEILAKKLETLVLSVPFWYDLPSVSQTADRLQASNEPVLVVISPLPQRPSVALAKQFLPRQGNTLFVCSSEIDDIPLFCDTLKKLQQDGLTLGDIPGGKVEHLDEPTTERWYPLIDFNRCIGCLECVNFCLFGVYAIDENGKPFVDQPNACRNGCPACSRVCPSKAIIFPLYDDPVISGTSEEEQTLDDLVDTLD